MVTEVFVKEIILHKLPLPPCLRKSVSYTCLALIL